MKNRLIALIYVVFLFVSLPFIPELWKKMQQWIGNVSDVLGYWMLAASVLFILARFIKQRRGLNSFLGLLFLTCLYVIGMSRVEFAVEKVHFIEYSLLSLLVLRALRPDLSGALLYATTLLICCCINFLDEGVQYLLPNRFGNIQDVTINFLAIVLGLFLTGLCLGPASVK